MAVVYLLLGILSQYELSNNIALDYLYPKRYCKSGTSERGITAETPESPVSHKKIRKSEKE